MLSRSNRYQITTTRAYIDSNIDDPFYVSLEDIMEPRQTIRKVRIRSDDFTASVVRPGVAYSDTTTGKRRCIALHRKGAPKSGVYEIAI